MVVAARWFGFDSMVFISRRAHPHDVCQTPKEWHGIHLSRYKLIRYAFAWKYCRARLAGRHSPEQSMVRHDVEESSFRKPRRIRQIWEQWKGQDCRHQGHRFRCGPWHDFWDRTVIGPTWLRLFWSGQSGLANFTRKSSSELGTSRRKNGMGIIPGIGAADYE